MVFSAAGAFAFHDAARGVQATCVAFVAGRVGLVFDDAISLDVTSPAFTRDVDQIILRNVPEGFLAIVINSGELIAAVEVFEVCHRRLPLIWPTRFATSLCAGSFALADEEKV